MFTGIIENMGTIVQITQDDTNLHLYIQADFVSEIRVDQSIAHNGICLTIVEIKDNIYKVTAINETILKTNIGSWKIGEKINLERAMILGARLDGHIVQGHVDSTAYCTNKVHFEGSWNYTFEFDKSFASLVIEKGSITVNGTSLTCFNITDNSFDVAIIPYTFDHTIMQFIEVESIVNIEFDLIGKYILRSKQLNNL
jgi:riboflavin synthase